MLAVFFGLDRKAARDRAGDFIKEHSEGVASSIIDDVSFVSGRIVDAAGATPLFGGTEVFILDTPSASAAFQAEVHEQLEALAHSTNLFVVLEGPLLAAAKKKYQKHAAAFDECNADKAERYNIFALAEALAKKDKKQLWVLLHDAKAAGLREEEIIGMLWWQLKSLRLAAVTGSPEEANMKRFPYEKAKRALTKFAPGEVERLSHSLLTLYHDSHAGKREIDLALEQWTLSV